MTDAEQLALARRVDELEAECRALRARLDAAADASAQDDALGGGPEPLPPTAWTEPTGMTANLPGPAITDTEASDGIQDAAPKLRSIRPVADEFGYDNAPWPPDALTLRGLSIGSPSVGPLTLQFKTGSGEPGGIVRYVPSLTTPTSETNAKCLLACKVVDLQTGDARLEWCDATALGAIEVPDVSPGGDNYWPQGGDATTCYGSAIGDSLLHPAIELDSGRLVGRDWSTQYGFSVGGGLSVAGPLVVAGDAYAPQTVSIGGTNYTLLVKQ